MPTPRLTLDTNCLIHLENGTSQHAAVRAIVNAGQAGKLAVFVPAMAASENQPGGVPLQSYADFRAWLERLGAGHLQEVLPMLSYGVGFWGHALLVSASFVVQERPIHDLLHPGIAFEYSQFCAKNGLDAKATPIDRRWRNAKCDVQIAWSHVHAGNDVLVTEDKHFLAPIRRPRLVALGAGDIMTPEDAVAKFLPGAHPQQLC